MNVKLIKGYVLAILALVILAAAGILLLNNLGGEWRMQVFWKPVTLRPAAWLLLAAVGGLLVFWTIRRLLPKAIAALRAGKRKQAPRDDQSTPQPPAPARR